jgi:hypothetical protein
MANIENAKNLGQGIYTKQEVDTEIEVNEKFLQIKRVLDTTQLNTTSTIFQNAFTFTLDNCTIGSKINIIAHISNLWEGNQEGECRLVDSNGTLISNVFRQRAVNTSGWAMTTSQLIGEKITTEPSMTFILQVRGTGSNPNWWYNYASSVGANSSSFLLIESK